MERILPLEVCKRITLWTRRQDLSALCRTSRAFRSAAEPRLYETVSLGNTEEKTYFVLLLLHLRVRLAAHVRTFLVWQDPRYASHEPPPVVFWRAVQGALMCMRNLDVLLLYDPTCANTWILDPTRFSFRLREASFGLCWDEQMAAFVRSQPRLRALCTGDLFGSHDGGGTAEDEERQMEVLQDELSVGTLPTLEIFDGPLLVVSHLVRIECPLTHLQVMFDPESVAASTLLPTLLPGFSSLRKTLISLNVVELPEKFSTEVLRLLSIYSPQLHHLGTIPLPSGDRSKFYRALMSMRELRILQVDISRWDKHQSPPPMLTRMLVTELRTFCPSLRRVVFCMSTDENVHRVMWSRTSGHEFESGGEPWDQWQHQTGSGHQSLYADLWRKV